MGQGSAFVGIYTITTMFLLLFSNFFLLVIFVFLKKKESKDNDRLRGSEHFETDIRTGNRK